MNKKLTPHNIKNMSLDNLIEAYKQGYRLNNLQIEVPINVCQKAGQSGWASCDVLGGMCENTNCPGGCSDSPVTDCGCIATCSGVLPSQTPTQQPPSTIPPTLPPTTLPPFECATNQWNLPLLGCQNKYKVLLIGGVGAITLFLLTKRGEV